MSFKLFIATAIVAASTTVSTVSASEIGTVSFKSSKIKKTTVEYKFDEQTGAVFAEVTAFERKKNANPRPHASSGYHYKAISSAKLFIAGMKYEAAKDLIVFTTPEGKIVTCATVRNAYWPFGGVVIEPTENCSLSGSTSRAGFETNVTVNFSVE